MINYTLIGIPISEGTQTKRLKIKLSTERALSTKRSGFVLLASGEALDRHTVILYKIKINQEFMITMLALA